MCASECVDRSARPSMSVLMPVFDGGTTLNRAIASVCGQTFADRELLVIDDCSKDNSRQLLLDWSQREHRIRVLQTPTNQGCAAARNLGLQQARGEFVAYLDCDDEFYPHYLDSVARHRSKGNVLLCQFDWETVGPRGDNRVVTWDPAAYRDCMFLMNCIGTLAIAHRREDSGPATFRGP